VSAEVTTFLAEVKTVWPRFMLESVQAKNELTNLLPTHTKSWWPLVVEDVFGAPAVADLCSRLLMDAVKNRECQYISIDGTFRVCFSLLGQARFDAPASVRDTYPFHSEVALTRVISIRGRSGCVLGLVPAADEGADELIRCIRESLPEDGLKQVVHVATDAPSKKLHLALAASLPSFEGLSLDATHAAMRYEQATGGRKTAGSVLLRAFLTKFAGHDVTVNTSIWGPMYDGSRQCSLSPQETQLREQISTQVMSKRKAQRIVSDAAQLQVWPTRIQFIEALAALSSLHAGEMHRKLEGSKMTVAKMLHSLASSEKVEWLFNALRYRHGLPFHVRMLLPSGTTANEALHAELNNFFRQIQSMHRSTLSLKLNILRLGKLMSHNLALFSPTARQMPGAHVLARRLGKPVWTKDTWLAWVEDGRKNGESLPYKKRLLEEQRLTSRKARAKRPACVKRTRKRTVFTLPRDGNVRIRRGGVKAKPAVRKAKSSQ
jgi:hypothetical protein